MFGEKRDDLEYAALLDIGSGSVTVSIISSTRSKERIEYIWSQQEKLALSSQRRNELDQSKYILTAVMSAMLALGSEGLIALRSYDSRGRINSLQCSIAAPWSYTINKNVRVAKEKPFTLSKQLLQDVLHSAERKINVDLQESEVAASLQLILANRSVAQVSANDYPIKYIQNQQILSLEVSLLSVVMQEYLQAAIKKNQQTVLPDAKLKIYSFMNILYYMLRNIRNDINECCLVNLTYDAVEIGLMREGILHFSTHEPYGVSHYICDIAEIIDTSPSEILGWLESGHWHDLHSFPTRRSSEIGRASCRERVYKNTPSIRNTLF